MIIIITKISNFFQIDRILDKKQFLQLLVTRVSESLLSYSLYKSIAKSIAKHCIALMMRSLSLSLTLTKVEIPST